jgi:hypothetical protein
VKHRLAFQRAIQCDVPLCILQVLLATGCINIQDFEDAEPFLFLGIPGHVLLLYIKESPCGKLVLKPGLELELLEGALGTSWADALCSKLQDAQTLVIKANIKADEWRYAGSD